MLLSSQDLGAALRAKRRAAGLTQADLAQRAGCRRQTIVAIEGSAHETEKFLRQGCVQCQVEACPNWTSDQRGKTVRVEPFSEFVDTIDARSMATT